MKLSPYLSVRLAAQVSLSQALVFATAMLLMCIVLVDKSVYRMSESLADDVASAIHENGGEIVFDQNAAPAEFTQSRSAWLIAVDDKHRTVEFGPVPNAYRVLGATLNNLGQLEVSTKMSSFDLVSRLVVKEHSWGTTHTLVGGVPQGGFLEIYYFLLRLFGGWIGVPLFITIGVVTPWIIHRSLRGTRAIAEEAFTIDLSRKGKTLDISTVPAEIQPLVSAFNEALQRLWQAADERERFLADAAHELRMPIAVLGTRLSSFPPSEGKNRLKLDLSRLENLAEQLLDLQRIGRTLRDRKIVDLTEICREVASDMAPLIVEAGYLFSVEIHDKAICVLADSGSLRRLMISLLHNAMIHGGGTGEITIGIDKFGVIRVLDCGPGIPPAERTNVFQPFYRLNATGGGSGLGLHLARETVLLLGGTIRISDAPKGGAAFIVSLPVAKEF